MNKEYQYTYDEINFREKMAVLFERILHEQPSGSYVMLILLFFLSGSAFLISNSNGPGIFVGPLLMIVGITFAFRLFRYYYKRKKYKMLLDQTIEDKVQELNATNGIIHVGFYDNHLSFGGEDTENKLEWEKVHSYLKIDHYLFIIVDIDQFSAFGLNSMDISNSEFLEVCEFVEEKLTPHALSGDQPLEKVSNPELLDD